MKKSILILGINAPSRLDLIVLDGIDAFVEGGPMNGRRVQGNVFLASTDRVAIDSVGVVVLKSLGSNDQIMKPKTFQQEQIAGAVELGRGASSPLGIDLLPADDQSRDYRNHIAEILETG